jgi:hypothetical protein
LRRLMDGDDGRRTWQDPKGGLPTTDWTWRNKEAAAVAASETYAPH